jgi:Abnormal spindle-like microcephaly-assoc'd, ASPM-SPD-2-Hydin
VYGISAIFSRGKALSALKGACSFEGELPCGVGQCKRWGQAFLFALACLLTMVASGCGGGASVPAASSPTSPQSSPQLTVSGANLSFGSVTINTATMQTLTLTSTGTAPVTISSATITGAGFTIVGGVLPVTLNPQQSMTLQVQFDPASPGTDSGQITISSNSSGGSTAAVALTGTGTTGSGTQTSPQLVVSAASLSFGSVAVNTTTMQALTLTSTGTAPVTVSSAAIAGAGFTIVAQSFPVTLNPTQSLTLQIQFDPAAAGAASGQISISSNSTTGGTVLVALGGTGTAGNSQLTISTASLSFGSVAVNTATTQSLTLTSTGTTPVTVNSATIAGAGFTIVGGGFPVTLSPSQTQTLQLKFDPSTAGALTGQITISSNSTSGGTAVVTLSGTGTAVAHEVDLSWDAPTSSPDPVAGYNVYRATGGGSLVLVNSSPDSAVVYVDSAVTSGATYSYVVKSVDSGGVESVPSNEITVTIP